MTNAIFIQSKLLKDNFDLELLTAELLDVSSVEDFQRFHAFNDLSIVTEKIKSLEATVESVGRNFLSNSTKLLPGIRTLRKIMSYWTLTGKVNPSYPVRKVFNEIREKSLFIKNYTSIYDLRMLEEIIDSVKQVVEFSKVDSEMLNAIIALKSHLNHLESYVNRCDEKLNILTNLDEKTVREFKEKTQIVKVSQDYEEHFGSISDLDNELQQMKLESPALTDFANERAGIGYWNDFVKNQLEVMNKKWKGQKTLTAGLPNGLIDLQIMFTNLRTERFENMTGSKRSAHGIGKMLNLLEKLTNELLKLRTLWRRVQEDKQSSELMIERLKDFSVLTSDFSADNLTRSIETVQKCNYPFTEEKLSKAGVKSFETCRATLETWKMLLPLFIDGNKETLKEMQKDVFLRVQKTLEKHFHQGKYIEVYEVLGKLKEVYGLAELNKMLKIFTKTKEWQQLLQTANGNTISIPEDSWLEVEKVVTENKFHTDFLPCILKSKSQFATVKHSLNIIEAVENLKRKKSEFSSIHAVLEGTKAILKQWKSVKKIFKDIEKEKSRTGYLAMKNVEELTRNLGGGVNVLVNLRTVYLDRLLIEDLIEQGKKVKKDLANVTGSSWTEENQKGIQKLLGQLIGLSYRSEDLRGGKDILKTGMIFQEAIRLKGVPIDIKKLIMQLTYHFWKSGGYEVQKFIGMLQRLEHLQLDYSSSSYPLKAAHHALLDIRKYFDELLGENTGTTTEIPEVTVVTEKVEKPILSVFEWIFVGMGVFALGGIALAVYYCITVSRIQMHLLSLHYASEDTVIQRIP